MNPKKAKLASEMKASERYEYFIRKVCDFEVVWGLYNEGWATGKAGLDSVIPVWPEREFAASCSAGEWSGFSPREIPLDDFMVRWIPGATADGNRFAIFPTPNQRAITVENNKLLADIGLENSSYD